MLKTDRILALDIGADSIKLGEFTRLKTGGIELINYGVGLIGAEGESDRGTYLSMAIKEVMRERGIRPGPVLISVSGQSVFLRFVKLPPVNQEKVAQIVQYEAQQNVPFPIDEVVWDYQLIGGGADGELDVMLSAIKSDIVETITDAVEAAGLTPDLVDVAPLALYNAVRYNYSDLESCALVIDIGSRSTDLIFVDGNRFFCRSIPVAGNAITQQIAREFDMSVEDAEDLKRAHAFVSFGGAYEGPRSEVAGKVSKIVRNVMTRMHAEINRSINFYRGQQNGRAPEQVFITGASGVIPYLDNFLKDKMKLEVDYFNPFLNVAVSQALTAEEIGRHAYVMGECVGLGLRRALTCPIEINLMPQKVLAEKALKKKEPMLIVAVLIVVMVLAVWCGYFFKMTTLSKEKLKQVDAEVQRMSAIEKDLSAAEAEVAEVNAAVDKVKAVVGQRTEWLQVLDEVHGAIPPGMWVTAITPEQPAAPSRRGSQRGPGATGDDEVQEGITRIQLSGLGHLEKMTSPNPIRAYRDALRESDFFNSEETEISYQPLPVSGELTREFRIVVVLENPLGL